MESKGVISMTQQEVKQLYVIQQALEHKIRQRHAAELLKLSVRHIRRLIKRVRQEGPKGIVHRLRGRCSNRRHAKSVKHRTIKLYKTKYYDFGPTLFHEKLMEHHHIRINRETLRQWLLAEGLWTQKRKSQKHHQWRERKHCLGEMIQLDGSHHDWLEGRGPKLVLMGYIDDATNRVFARFYDYEGTIPAMDSFYYYTKLYGLPQSVYTDLHTTYRSPAKPTVEDELAGRLRPKSQFERALGELEVQMIYAYSPQAKGRIERLFRTFQDRLVKEMRLKGIKTLKDANHFLEGYLPIYNSRFNRKPHSKTNLHRPQPKACILKRILAIRHLHALRNDNTIKHNTNIYLVKERWNGHRPKKIQTEERLNCKLYLMDQDHSLSYREVKERPYVSSPVHRSPSNRRAVIIPPLDHPWRRFKLPGSQRIKSNTQKRTFLMGVDNL